MQIFLAAVLTTSLALAIAEIPLHQGYNYQAQQSIYPLNNSQQGLIMQILAGPIQPTQSTHASLPNSLLQGPVAQPSGQYLPVPSLNNNNNINNNNNNFINSIGAQNLALPMSLPMPLGFPGAPRPPSRRARPRVKITKKPIITKNFFIHSAPEETEEDIQDELAQLQQQPRKHYNVLFVKTPAQTSRTAALSLAKALKEEKTVVYVLSKKTNAADLQEAIADAPQHINKPEVFFIKYRTPEEAANAQRQIQSQYDTLGGTSTITDEGVAPITSVVGSLDAPEEDESEEELSQSLDDIQQPQYNEQLAQAINNQYLPPTHRL